MSAPPPGHIRLYSSIVPPLKAGRYRLVVNQDIDVPAIPDAGQDAASYELPEHERPIEVVAPRFRMAGTELQSLFPPPFAEGAFSNRFAQAALKRRTLPWERDPDRASAAREPWLALVVLAKDEGTFRTDLPLTHADLADLRAAVGLSAGAAAAAGKCDVLEVSGRTVRKSLPARSDLPYLTHVREVNLTDTEYAGTDDDGFIAIVSSNRVLRGGMSYGAYLVSVEGQLDVLPTGAGAITDEIGPVTDPGPRFVVTGGLRWGAGETVVDASGGRAPRIAGGAGRVAAGAEGLAARLDGWTADAATVEEHAERLAELGLSLEDVRVVEDADSDAGVTFEPDDFEPGDNRLHRFPVLAHWTFRTIPGGDFETLMQRLDVGVLGTVDAEAPDAPTVLATGHGLIDRTTWAGERGAAWYRGPLAPLELGDRDDVPLHTAEQAIRIGRDGIEDVSYAAAFEIGRLLALSSPRFVSALVAWRRRGATGAWDRFRRDGLGVDLLPPLDLPRLEELERYLAIGAIGSLLGGPPDAIGEIGPLGPLVNPVPLRETYDIDRDVSVLERLGLSRALVEDALGVATAPSGFGEVVVEPAGLVDTGTFDDVVAGGVFDGLVNELGRRFDDDVAIARELEEGP